MQQGEASISCLSPKANQCSLTSATLLPSKRNNFELQVRIASSGKAVLIAPAPQWLFPLQLDINALIAGLRYLKCRFPNLVCVTSPRAHVGSQTAGSQVNVSDLICLRWGLRISISNKFPDTADASSLK